MSDAEHEPYALGLKLMKAFIKQTTEPLLGPQSGDWYIGSPQYVQFHKVDVLYQYDGLQYPGEEAFSKDEWCKLCFSNGKYRRRAYAGIVIEGLRADDRLVVQELFGSAEGAAWVKHLRRNYGFKLVKGWDPYRPREEDENPESGPLLGCEDPLQELRAEGLGGLVFLREVPFEKDGGVRSKDEIAREVREALTLVFPAWRAIVRHQIRHT